ncbi:hypothetical protein JW968_01340 [Candidatus Woesearchaeota archaeon]|nr:hypothetical protein [Candidatus Woesearchaeota archaeon]
MKLSNKIIEEVVTDIAGQDVMPLVKILRAKKNISEFKLAETLKQEVNETRNMLYRLYHRDLVSFARRKDKKKGWYIYYWNFNPKRVRFLMDEIMTGKLVRLQERLGREEEGFFFFCNNNCMRLDFDQASNFNFKCPECGAIMQHDDNVKKISELRSDISDIERIMGLKVRKAAARPKAARSPKVRVTRDKPARKTAKKKIRSKK